MDRQIHRWINKQMGAWGDEQTDGQMNRSTGGRANSKYKPKEGQMCQGSLAYGCRISTVNLLGLTSSDRLCFKLKLYFFYKTSYLNEEVNLTEPSPKGNLNGLTDVQTNGLK